MPDNETQRSGLPFNEKSLTLFNQWVSSWVMIGTPVRKGGRTSLSPAPKNRPDYYHPVKTSSVSSHGFQRSVPTNMMVLKVSSFGRRKSKVLGPSYWVQMWPWISGHRSRLGFVGCCERALAGATISSLNHAETQQYSSWLGPNSQESLAPPSIMDSQWLH